MGVPHISRMTLFGSRVDPIRACTIATVFMIISIKTGLSSFRLQLPKIQGQYG